MSKPQNKQMEGFIVQYILPKYSDIFSVLPVISPIDIDYVHDAVPSLLTKNLSLSRAMKPPRWYLHRFVNVSSHICICK